MRRLPARCGQYRQAYSLAAKAANKKSPKYKGHIVRVVGITDEGLLIDDPFGESDIVEFYTGSTRWSSKNSSNNNTYGGDSEGIVLVKEYCGHGKT